jgi:hypothetical protein
MDDRPNRTEAQRLASNAAHAALDTGADPGAVRAEYSRTMDGFDRGESSPAAAAEAPVDPPAAPTWQELLDSGELRPQHLGGLTSGELDSLEEAFPGLIQHATVTLPKWRGEQEEGDHRRAQAAEQAALEQLPPEEIVAREDIKNLKARLPFLSTRQIKEEAGLHGLDADQLQREHDAELKMRFDPIKDPRLAVDDEGGQG